MAAQGRASNTINMGADQALWVLLSLIGSTCSPAGDEPVWTLHVGELRYRRFESHIRCILSQSVPTDYANPDLK